MTPPRPLITAGLTLISFISLSTATIAESEPILEPPQLSDVKIEPKPETTTPAPLVKKISANIYQIGIITLNKKTREITLPAHTNITDPETILEYLLVHSNGNKVHESLLITEADPIHLNIAFKLLNYQESPELFTLLKADGTESHKYPTVTKATRKAARFNIDVTWKKGNTLTTAPVTSWLKHSDSGKTMPHTPWVYNGSLMFEKKFIAKLTGTLFSIYSDRGAIANYPGKDRHDDTVWFAAPDTPREGSSVTVTIKPCKQ